MPCPVCGTVRWTLAVTGSRSLARHADLVLGAARDGLLELRERMGGRPARVLHGDAPGVDRILAARLRQAGWPVTAMRADWDRHGRRAGILRDLSLIARADALLAIWDGTSTNTHHTLKLAADRDLPVVSHILGDQPQPDLQPPRPHPPPPVVPDSPPEPEVGQDVLPLSRAWDDRLRRRFFLQPRRGRDAIPVASARQGARQPHERRAPSSARPDPRQQPGHQAAPGPGAAACRR